MCIELFGAGVEDDDLPHVRCLELLHAPNERLQVQMANRATSEAPELQVNELAVVGEGNPRASQVHELPLRHHGAFLEANPYVGHDASFPCRDAPARFVGVHRTRTSIERTVYSVKAMPRPRSLTHDAIAAAALELVDRDGLSALSMRTVASELGVGAMSLYRYVEHRGQLEALMVERVLGAVDVSIPPAAGWRRSLVLLVDRARDAVAEHPAIVPLLLVHRHASKSSRAWGEAVLGVLDEAGFGADARVIGFRSLLSYVLGAVQVEHYGSLAGAGTAALAESPSEFPLLAETAQRARKISVEREFHQGLDVVLDGLEALRKSKA